MRPRLLSTVVLVAVAAHPYRRAAADPDQFSVIPALAAWHQSSANRANYVNEGLTAHYASGFGLANLTLGVAFEVFCDVDTSIRLPTQRESHIGWTSGDSLSLPRAEYPIPGYSAMAPCVEHTCYVVYRGGYTTTGGGFTFTFDGFGIGVTGNDVHVSDVGNDTFPVMKDGQCHVCQDPGARGTIRAGTPDIIDGCVPDSPILLDLGQNGFDLGPAGVGVYFDNDANGRPERMQWVRRGGDEAFLVMDRNGNGVVDNGSELFGIGTPLIVEGGRAPNGFAGLAQYDAPDLGGNDDGWITADDDVWTSLRLWLDRNADGICTPDEILTLESAGVRALPTIPRTSFRRDAAGNYLRYQADALTDLKQRKMRMIDVYFLRL
ncbi:MAG TPA: hypothetical protein VHT91_21480 [Kofleriaceae bacterium]|jgi:hypothetical protein|nr:hypothetical protein [Kofleriaceae bacterium]